MLKNYKKSYLIINIILVVVFIIMLTNLLVLKKTNYNFLTMVLLIPTVFLILMFGYERKSRRFKYELIFYIFAYCSIFLLVTYMIGLKVGFTKNVYKLNFANLKENIIPYLFLIVTSEVLRYQISRKGDGSLLSHVLITFILIFVDASIFLKLFDLSTGDGQIKYICSILMPSFFKNAALMFFTKKGGIYPSLLYRILLDLKLVIVPIFPNFGIYYDSIVNTVFPLLLLFIIYLTLRKDDNQEDAPVNIKKTKLYKFLIYFMILGSLLSINVLVGGNLRYCMIAIGSESMKPNLNKGDAIIYEKYSSRKKPEVGQVLVFRKDKKIIVHRIIEIVKIDNKENIYYTKGDNNEKPDGYPIETRNVLGVVKNRIKYIGIPSVMLSELMK